MRGGLGRTLLTAFLVLAILPLSAVTWYATGRERYDIQREVTAKLTSVSAIMETQIHHWIEHPTRIMALLAALPDTQESVHALVATASNNHSTIDPDIARETLYTQLHALQAHEPALLRLAVLDNQGQILVSTDISDLSTSSATTFTSEQFTCFQFITLDYVGDAGLIVNQPITAMGNDDEILGVLTGWLNPCDLVPMMQTASELETMGKVYLVDANGWALSLGEKITSPGIQAALSGENTE